MTMVASFMPSLAFATAHTHTYAVVGANSGTVTLEALNNALKGDDASTVSVVKPATCTENGKAVVTCTSEDCDEAFADHSKTVAVTASHVTEKREFTAEQVAEQLVKQENWTKAVAETFLAAAPTADKAKIAAGEPYCYYEVEYCTACNKIVTTITSAAGVTTSSDGVKAVDHMRDNTSGCNTVAPCFKCGKKVGVSDITAAQATGHTPADDEWVVVSKPTCTTAGKVQKACKICGEASGVGEKDDPNAPALGHDISAAKATATEAANADGSPKGGYYRVVKKNEYGDIVSSEYYKANGITGFTKAGTPSANVCGTEDRGLQCAACKNFIVTDATYTLEDTGAVFASAAKGSVPPAAVYSVNVTKHDYVETEHAATCTADAYTSKTCKNCDFAGTNDVKKDTKLGHSYKAVEVKADCENAGSFSITCTNKDCPTNATERLNITSSTNLDTALNVVKDKDGKYYFTGFSNGKLAPSDYIVIPKVAAGTGTHKFGPLTLYKAATCAQGEIWANKCTVCNKINPASLTEKTSTKLAHSNLVKVEVPATCGSEGYYVIKCADCDLYKTATGFASTGAKKYDVVKPIVKDGAACTYDKWVVTKAATIFEEGVKTLTCSVCGDKEYTKTVIAKAKYAAPAVKAGKKSATVTVKATEGAVSYKVSYKKAGGSYKTVAAQAGKKTIKKLAKGKKYTFKVIAVNAEGVEVASATKTVKVK